MRASVAVLAMALSSAGGAVPPAPPGDAAQRPTGASLAVLRPLDSSYPPKSRRLGQEGTVTVRVQVGRDGVPTDCRVVGTSGHADLDQATCDKMLLTRYAPPADDRGEPAASTFTQAVRWVLDPPAPPAAAAPAR